MAQESCTVNLTDKRCLALFQGLKLSSWQPDILRIEEESPSDSYFERQQSESLQSLSVSSKMTCSVCACDFQSRLHQTEHYKLDWHRFNLKQSMMGAESVSEEHFESMTGDISSISGSDDSDDEVTSALPPVQSNPESPQRSLIIGNYDVANGGLKTSGRGLPKIFFKNGKGQLLAIYRCLLQGKKESLLTQSELVLRATRLQDSQKWSILMVAGGHFAAAIFDGSEVVSHKTFHRYTVRAKRGTAQGVRDGQQGGNQPRSAGASLRRYNEAQLQEDVGNLLKSWKDHIDGCSHIFIRAPSYNRTLFFGGKSAVLMRDDSRIGTVPFPTRRPTFKEVKRVQNLLSTIERFENVDEAKRKFSHSKVVAQKPVPDGSSKGGNITTGVDKQDQANGFTDDAVKGELPQTDRTSDMEESDGDEIELIMEEVTSFTSHLKEMEISVPKKRRRRKKRNTPLEEEDGLKDKELKKLQAAIYTCCKTNEGNSFECLMIQLEKKISQDIRKKELETSINNHASNENCDSDSKYENSSEENCLKKSTPRDESIGESIAHTRILEYSIGASETTSESLKCKRALVLLDAADVPQDNSSNESEPLLAVSECTTSVENGHSKEVEENIARFLNERLDPNENRFLHIAALGARVSLVWKLMANGADPAIKNVNGHHPITLANSKNTRLEFSRFMGEHPEKFDYKAARIPPPLTEEQEAAKTAKMKEKRKVQKKAKDTRRKEQKEEQQRKDQEEKERQQFVALSDREKRALAAEKRLTSQLGSKNRCFACGVELEGKVPFHYQDFKFCMMTCLKKHKQQQNT